MPNTSADLGNKGRSPPYIVLASRVSQARSVSGHIERAREGEFQEARTPSPAPKKAKTDLEPKAASVCGPCMHTDCLRGIQSVSLRTADLSMAAKAAPCLPEAVQALWGSLSLFESLHNLHRINITDTGHTSREVLVRDVVECFPVCLWIEMGTYMHVKVSETANGQF